MKAWFSYCHAYDDEVSNVKLGIGWYKHHKDHKWKGFTVNFYLWFGLLSFNYVNKYSEYNRRINHNRLRKGK